MKKIFYSIILIFLTMPSVFGQTITFSPTVAGTGFLPSNNSSGGISFLIQNTNPYPAVMTSLSYWSATATTKDWALWYAPTTVGMPVTFPLTVASGFNPIASVSGVAMGAGVLTTCFPILAFTIPASTTYRFYLTSANVPYTGVSAIGGSSGVSPTTFSNSGVNFMVAEAQFAGQNVGWGGGNFSPRAFLGSVTLNLLSSPCVGQPTAGVASALPNNPCPGTNITLALTGTTAASGLAFQWQRSSTGSAPWLTIPGATTSPYLYMPPPGSTTFYRCIVVCTASGLNDTSNVTAPVVVQSWTPTSPCYCNGLATSTAGNDIGQFVLGTYSNPLVTPTPKTSNPTATGGITNNMSLTPNPTLIQGLTYPLNIYQITSAVNNTNCWAKVWIDYNHNANFTDPGEEVFSGSSDASNLFDASGSFTVPPTSLPGCTRMRVKLFTGGTATTTTPCNNIATGEVEDYLVCINPAGPHDPTISAITAPTFNTCPDSSETLSATVCNYGSIAVNLAINPYYITYTVDGPTGPVTYMDTLNSGILPAFGGSCLTSTVSPVNMFMGGNYAINAVVSCPTISINNFLGNDSLANAINMFNYRPIASPPYNLCQFSNIPFGQGLGVSGCSSPLFDTVVINFTVAPCNDNIGSTGNGTATGLPANCADQFACSFGTGIVPLLPPGATFTSPAVLSITNLKENALVPATVNTEVRMNLYKTNPIGANLLSPGGTVASLAPGATATNFTYQRNISTGNLSNIFTSIPAGGILNIGYWESYQDNTSLPDIDYNAGAPTVATLTIYYQFVPPAFAWYDVPTGGSSLYSLSPFDPLSYTNAVVNNSNVAGNYTFYAACLGLPDCRVPVDLLINPTPAAIQDSILSCEYVVGANNAIFDLTTLNSSVSAGLWPTTTVEFFGDQSLLLPILTPTTDTSSTNYIYSKVSFPSTGCFSSDTVYLEVNSIPQFSLPVYSGFACAPSSIDISSLINVFPPTGNDTTFFSDPSFTIPFVNPGTISVADTVYMIVKTNNGVVCADSSVAYIDVLPSTTLIASQDIPGNFSICGPIPPGNITLSDGNTETLYTTTDCRRIATVKDSLDGTSLGVVNITENIDCSIQTYNGQPYVARNYEITPATNGKAIVCLYYLDQDFADYTAAAFPTFPSMDPTTNLCITQVDNGVLGSPTSTAISIPNSSITTSYDPSTTVWTVCFPVDSFSTFYCHTCNPLNAALPVNLLSFTGQRKEGISELNWVTLSEQNNSHFRIERSKDAKTFQPISPRINSKAMNGNSSDKLYYSYNDVLPLTGHNYYRLEQVDIDGKISYSGTVDVYFGNETMFNLYPNPVNTELTVEINTPKATDIVVKIIDVTGRIVETVSLSLQSGLNSTQVDMNSLASGIYLVSITNNKGINYTQSIRKK